MKEAGVVVVVDGPSCVGRSTTLAGLQAAWPEVRPGPLLASGLDAMLSSFGPGEPRWHRLLLPDVVTDPDRVAEPYVHWGPLGREMVVAMHRSAAAWAHAGVDVAMDHLLLDHATATDLTEVLEGLRVVHVGLTCDPDVLDERERDLYGTAGPRPPSSVRPGTSPSATSPSTPPRPRPTSSWRRS